MLALASCALSTKLCSIPSVETEGSIRTHCPEGKGAPERLTFHRDLVHAEQVVPFTSADVRFYLKRCALNPIFPRRDGPTEKD